MELKIDHPQVDLFNVKMKLCDIDLKLSFKLRLIMADDIDSICDARDTKPSAHLCLLTTGNIAILDSVQIQCGADVGPAVMIRKYNSHPLVRKGTYPHILKYVTVTQSVVEGVVLCGDAFKYFTSK